MDALVSLTQSRMQQNPDAKDLCIIIVCFFTQTLMNFYEQTRRKEGNVCTYGTESSNNKIHELCLCLFALLCPRHRYSIINIHKKLINTIMSKLCLSLIGYGGSVISFTVTIPHFNEKNLKHLVIFKCLYKVNER